jgi:hypothetical protein
MFVKGKKGKFYIPDEIIDAMIDLKCNNVEGYLVHTAIAHTFLKDVRGEPGDSYMLDGQWFVGPKVRLKLDELKAISFSGQNGEYCAVVYDYDNFCFIQDDGKCLYIDQFFK